MRSVLLLAAVLAGAVAAGCGDEPDSSHDTDQVEVVATTHHVADFARQVAGDRASVTTLIPANADPHDFEPRPSDARAVAEADVVLRSGGDIDDWLDGVVEAAGGEAQQIVLIDSVKTISGAHAHDEEHAHEQEHTDEGIDPHWWQDPRNVRLATERIATALTQADGAGRDVYRRNTARYAERLEELDQQIAECMRSIPAERRKLVSAHDAYGYFARRFGIEVLGSIIPSLSTSAQPSAGEARRLVNAVKREGVKTIFTENAVSSRLEQAIARDAGAEVSEALYGDTLGPAENATYLDALRHDAGVMADGFGGTCSLANGA